MTALVNCNIVSRGDEIFRSYVSRSFLDKKWGDSWLIFTCDWLEIVLNKNNLIKGCCYEGKIAKPELPI